MQEKELTTERKLKLWDKAIANRERYYFRKKNDLTKRQEAEGVSKLDGLEFNMQAEVEKHKTCSVCSEILSGDNEHCFLCDKLLTEGPIACAEIEATDDNGKPIMDWTEPFMGFWSGRKENWHMHLCYHCADKNLKIVED